MEPRQGKRARSEKPKAFRKRQKLDELDRRNKSLSAERRAGKPVQGKIVALDNLAWKEVTLPEQLEDAEGFFGLEEIDDVEVVRDEGVVQYRVAGPNGAVTKASEVLDVLSSPDGDDDSPDWEGFEDDGDSHTVGSIAQPSKATGNSRPLSTKQKRNKEKYKQDSDTGRGKPSLNEFEALAESDDEEVDVTAWNSLGLSDNILSALARLGFSRPTPIQKAAIPSIQDGHDVVGKASTGSGKTLAFGIPILESFLQCQNASTIRNSNSEERLPIALILSPTRELAHQLEAHISALCSRLTVDSPRIATLTGGLSVHKQQRLLATADIVIGTPGRLWEVISSAAGILQKLKGIRYLVVDEADRLLSEGHFKEVEKILAALDKEEVDGLADGDVKATHAKSRQTLVFSATFQKDLQSKLAGRGRRMESSLLNNKQSLEYLLKKLNFREERPKFIDVNRAKQMASNLREGLFECGALEKDLYLYAVLLHYPKTRTLIFTNSISSVRRLVPFLQNLDIITHSLHSEMPQKARLRSIERFASTTSPGSVLVATDVAARGLDIPAVEVIVHYHIPRAADMYVHRSGRTARAEQSGTSVMLCSPEEVVPVRRLVTKVHDSTKSSRQSSAVNTLSFAPTLLSRLKPRVTLSQKLVSAATSKTKKSSEDNWLRKAADDLGVDYDSEEFAAEESQVNGRGRGKGKKRAMREEAEGVSKQQMGAWRAELKDLLSHRVNTGVSEKYLSSGGIDIDALLAEKERGEFLGTGYGIIGWE